MNRYSGRFTALVLTLLLSSSLLAAKQAVAQNSDRVVRTWVAGQRSVFGSLQSYSFREHAQTRIDPGGGPRTFELTVRRSAARGDSTNGRESGREVEMLRVNGQEIDTDRANRFVRQQRAMIRPELLQLFDRVLFPFQESRLWEMIGAPQVVSRDGEDYLRIEGVLAVQPPFAGPPGRDGRLNPPIGRDFRPPARRRNGGPPDFRSGTPPFSDSLRLGPNPGPDGPRPSFTAWFTPDGTQLHAVEIVVFLPGSNTFTVQTLYRRVNGLDIPESRLASGNIPVRRRSRMFSVSFTQRSDYSEFEWTRQ